MAALTTLGRKRIMIDIARLQSDVSLERDYGIAVLNCEDLSKLRFNIGGPLDSPYAGGVFAVELRIPDNFPVKAPEVYFMKKLWHPNVSSSNGYVCLDVLKSKWRPVCDLRFILLSLHSLLKNPNADDALDATVGNQMVKNDQLFRRTAKMWTKVHAGGCDSDPEMEEKLNLVEEMGLGQSIHQRLEMLSKFDWDVDKTVAVLVGEESDTDSLPDVILM